MLTLQKLKCDLCTSVLHMGKPGKKQYVRFNCSIRYRELIYLSTIL